MKEDGKVMQVSGNIGGVGYKSVVRKTAEGDHFPVNVKIIVHNGTSFEK